MGATTGPTVSLWVQQRGSMFLYGCNNGAQRFFMGATMGPNVSLWVQQRGPLFMLWVQQRGPNIETCVQLINKPIMGV
jgi:hypothetical protein